MIPRVSKLLIAISMSLKNHVYADKIMGPDPRFNINTWKFKEKLQDMFDGLVGVPNVSKEISRDTEAEMQSDIKHLVSEDSRLTI